MGKQVKAAPEPCIKTFDEAFSELRLSPSERCELVYRLAAIRARKTIEVLLPRPTSTKQEGE